MKPDYSHSGELPGAVDDAAAGAHMGRHGMRAADHQDATHRGGAIEDQKIHRRMDYFTAPAVRPRTTWRWTPRYKMTGSSEKITPAASS